MPVTRSNTPYERPKAKCPKLAHDLVREREWYGEDADGNRGEEYYFWKCRNCSAEGSLADFDESPCNGNEYEDADHDWHYDGGDASVGVNGAWICRRCGAVDCDREPPSYDDDIAF